MHLPPTATSLGVEQAQTGVGRACGGGRGGGGRQAGRQAWRHQISVTLLCGLVTALRRVTAGVPDGAPGPWQACEGRPLRRRAARQAGHSTSHSHVTKTAIKSGGRTVTGGHSGVTGSSWPRPRLPTRHAPAGERQTTAEVNE